MKYPINQIKQHMVLHVEFAINIVMEFWIILGMIRVSG